MRQRYCLRGLRDEDLLSELCGLVKSGNALNADVLAHLAELDERRLYLELGFSSLFAYCMESLGLDESSTGRRITAARVCRRFPVVFERVASGALSLSVLCALNPHLNRENAAELFEACSNRSRRRVEEILAARFPKPDVKDLIRRTPNKAESEPQPAVTAVRCMLPVPTPPPTLTQTLSPPPTLTLPPTQTLTSPPTQTLTSPPTQTLTSPPTQTQTSPPTQTQTPTPTAAPTATESGSARPRSEVTRRRIEPLSVDRYGFHFTGDSSLKEKFERARALLSHELPSGEMAALFDLALDALLRDREKRRFSVGRKSRVSRCLQPPGESSQKLASEGLERIAALRWQKNERSRHIPASVAREVYARDCGRCCFVARNGRRCNSRAFLEIDHIQPFAAGGAPVAENLRLRCRAHNQWHALRYFGRDRIQAALLRRKLLKAHRQGEEAARDTAAEPGNEGRRESSARTASCIA